MIPAVIERCESIDVGKREVVACVMVGGAAAEPEWEVRAYGTTVEELRRLREWA